jgi:hypothetical protein
MTLMFDGQVSVGNCVSTTVTLNEQAPGLPEGSVTEQLTVVTPFANVEPEDGTQVTAGSPGQLSVAVAAG